MDWIIIAAVVIAGWAMLSVLSGERASKQNQLTVDLAQAKCAADRAAAASAK